MWRKQLMCYNVAKHQSFSKWILVQSIQSKVTCWLFYHSALTAMGKKYKLRTNHKIPSKEHEFPTQTLGSCNQSFRPTWLSLHPWIVYSEEVDGVFCISSSIFCTDLSKGIFVNKLFHVWNKRSEKAK